MVDVNPDPDNLRGLYLTMRELLSLADCLHFVKDAGQPETEEDRQFILAEATQTLRDWQTECN